MSAQRRGAWVPTDDAEVTAAACKFFRVFFALTRKFPFLSIS